MKWLKQKRFLLFRLWFGIGAPLYFFGALYVLSKSHIALGLLLFLSYVWRVYDSFTKTCARCPHYGTFDCGIQGKIASFFVKRKFSPLSIKAIKLHSSIDWIFMMVAFVIYLQNSWLGALTIVWPIGAYFLVYKPKRFHGLLFKTIS